MKERNREMNISVEDLHISLFNLTKHVESANTQYSRLQGAIARFQKLRKELDEMSVEADAAWGKLREAEQKLAPSETASPAPQKPEEGEEPHPV
jgi:predicted  nucleic acid-binding Zn-ribbon protein